MNPKILFIAAIVSGLVSTAFASEINPVAKTLTDTQGRTMNGRILGKTADTITFQRDDGKKFEIQIASLSTNDQKFILEIKGEEKEPAPMTSGIEPGKRVILALPFEKQAQGGICAAASILNILKFLDPKLQINQLEMFALFNSGKTGATPNEVIQGIRSLGFDGDLVRIETADEDTLTKRIIASLDDGRPMLVATRGHALTLIGYTVTNKKYTYYTWDQRMRGKASPPGFPQGVEERSESEFMRELVNVMFIEQLRSVKTSAPTPELAKEELKFTTHTVVNPHQSDKSDPGFFDRAATVIIKDQLRRGNRVFIQASTKKNEPEYYEVIGAANSGWSVKNSKDPSANQTLDSKKLGRAIEDAGGKLIAAAPLNEIVLTERETNSPALDNLAE